MHQLRTFIIGLNIVMLLLGSAAMVGITGCQDDNARAFSDAEAQIVLGSEPTAKEIYAARELQRYLFQMTDARVPIVKNPSDIRRNSFIIGQVETNPYITKFASTGMIELTSNRPGPQGYILKTIAVNAHDAILIAGGDDIGTLYGVYGLLDDHYGVGFYLWGDAIPEPKQTLRLVNVDETKSPRQYIRGVLPWTNFPQSATVYSFNDYRFVIDQMTKMRMNFLHIHNYNFGPRNAGHKEMFHNWTYNGITPRPWMATAKSGHGWACPGWNVNDYLFGGADLFDDYDFGSECALHNESLSDIEVTRKGISLFQRVIDYAHWRGVSVGLGIDINLVPAEYGVSADDPGIVEARTNQIIHDYPDLDVLLCFQSEDIHTDHKNFEKWHRIFDMMYKKFRAEAPQTKIAVSGWGLSKESTAPLPRDVISAPIAPYSASFEDGSVYDDLEYWACPWLERDFNSSEYYYPYNIDLSDTIQSYQAGRSNMKGLYCLTWRLTDAVDAKMSYIAKAPWDLENKYTSSEAVYHEYAVKNYGPAAASEITAIINQNEPFASNFGECAPTPEFTGSTRPSGGGFLFNIARLDFLMDGTEAVGLNAAEALDEHKGIQLAPYSQGGQCVGYIEQGDWVLYRNVNFKYGIDRITVRAASATEGGDIDIRLDRTDGPSIGMAAVDNTGGWQNWKDFEATVKYITGVHDVYLVFLNKERNDLDKSRQQLAVIDQWLERTKSPARRFRLSKLRCRIAAVRDHILLNQDFPSIRWDEMPGEFESWVHNFIHRIDDISSLGNIQSIENRFVQLRYLAKENDFRELQAVKSPSYLDARSTLDGAVLTWRNNEGNARGFHIYRDGEKINRDMVPTSTLSAADDREGDFSYQVTAVGADGMESPLSVRSTCPAGGADREAPAVFVISGPVSAWTSGDLEFKARVIDDRAAEMISARLHYCAFGDTEFRTADMDRRVKAVFTAALPAEAFEADVIEYFIEVSDGTNVSLFPHGAPMTNAFIVRETAEDSAAPAAPQTFRASGRELSWAAGSSSDVFWYKLYRGTRSGFEVGPDTYLTYVAGGTHAFKDLAPGFDGNPLKGTYYYRVTALDRTGNESAAAPAVAIRYE